MTYTYDINVINNVVQAINCFSRKNGQQTKEIHTRKYINDGYAQRTVYVLMDGPLNYQVKAIVRMQTTFIANSKIPSNSS